MIDARLCHNPSLASNLVANAIERAGSQNELAARCGVSRDYLRRIARSERNMSYTMQVTLERIATGE